MDAYSVDWTRERCYINPPWTDIVRVLKRIQQTGIRALTVLPYWPNATWFPLWRSLCVNYVIHNFPIYLMDNGELYPKPSWVTVVAMLQG